MAPWPGAAAALWEVTRRPVKASGACELVVAGRGASWGGRRLAATMVLRGDGSGRRINGGRVISDASRRGIGGLRLCGETL
jgi:hypothetical protein